MQSGKEYLTAEAIRVMFTDAAHDAELDNDGDVYITGSDIEFPIWVGVTDDKIRLFTYMRFKGGVELNDAYRFSNDLNGSVILPSFHVISTEDEEGQNLFLYGNYYILINREYDRKNIISTARRFAGAFKAGLLLDKNDKFFG